MAGEGCCSCLRCPSKLIDIRIVIAEARSGNAATLNAEAEINHIQKEREEGLRFLIEEYLVKSKIAMLVCCRLCTRPLTCGVACSWQARMLSQVVDV